MSKKKNNPITHNTPRLVRLDIMVALAMIFVVLGHMSFPFAPSWYNDAMHPWIYRFHMEVFVFLSAFLIRYSFKGTHSLGDYLRYIGRKFKKFFIPFLLVGVAIAMAKAWTYGIAKGDILPFTGQTIKTLLLYPMWSEASFLWYIYILFGYYLISPLVIRCPSWLKMTLCLGSMFLPLLGLNHFLGGYLFCKYTFFYFLGILCAEGWEQLKDLKTWLVGLLSLPFVLWSIKYILFCNNPTSQGTFLEMGPAYDVLSGCLALPFFYFLSRIIEPLRGLTLVSTRISKDCFWIYLMQMFVLWGCAYSLDLLGIHGGPFVLFILISAPLAIAIPIGCSWLSQKVGKTTLKKKSKASFTERPTKIHLK